MEEQTRILGFRVSAIVELLLFFVVAFVIDYLVMDGNRFWDVYPHPYWIPVILIAAKYGAAEAILAVVLASLALLLGNLPDQTYGQDFYGYLYTVAIRPLMWLVAGVAVGALRDMHIRERDELREELEQSRDREEKISESYEWVRDAKQKMELRIAGQLRSSIDTYKAAKAIEKLDPQDVLTGVRELVSAVMNPDKFSVYLRDNGSVDATIIHGWGDSDHYQRQYDGSSALFREVVGNSQVLCVANDEHERILDGEGVLAGPLVDTETGHVLGMLKIEKQGFADLNLSTIETFRAICEWVGMAFVNADKYQAAKADSVVNPDHNLMTPGYFKRYTDYISSLSKRLNFDVSMLGIKLIDADKMDPTVRLKVSRELAEVVESVLRSVDLAFDHHEAGEEYNIVLPATDKKGAKIVQEKIEKGLAKSKTVSNANFAYTVHAINEK